MPTASVSGVYHIRTLEPRCVCPVKGETRRRATGRTKSGAAPSTLVDKAIGLPTRRTQPLARVFASKSERVRPRVFTRARRSSRTPRTPSFAREARPKPRPSTVAFRAPRPGNVVMAFHAIVADASALVTVARAGVVARRPSAATAGDSASRATGIGFKSSVALMGARVAPAPLGMGTPLREVSTSWRWRAGAGAAAAAGAAAGAGAGAGATASRWTAVRCAMRTSTCPRCA